MASHPGDVTAINDKNQQIRIDEYFMTTSAVSAILDRGKNPRKNLSSISMPTRLFADHVNDSEIAVGDLYLISID